MVQVNPDLNETGKKQSPINHVTALFASPEQLPMILDDLIAEGFTDKDLEVFSGPEGAEKLDFRGRHQGVARRFLRDLAMFLSDERQVQELIDQGLREGGVFVSVDTHGNEIEKERAIAMLKANRGKNICFWGHLAVEHL